MKEFKGTKGEWSVFMAGDQPGIDTPNKSIIIYGDSSDKTIRNQGVKGNSIEQAIANAHLISAAPDLLAACQSLQDVLKPLVANPVHETLMAQLQAAINKALPE